MPVPALLLCDPGRLPFLGHARVALSTGGVTFAAAGRVGAEAGVKAAYSAARALEDALRGVAGPGDRHAWLWRAWGALAAMDLDRLGPARGQDLCLLLVAEDAGGIGVAGVGLSALWGLRPSELVPLVEGAHPLLSGPGLPAKTPGVLTLDQPVTAVVGNPAHLPPLAPPRDQVTLRCGVRA